MISQLPRIKQDNNVNPSRVRSKGVLVGIRTWEMVPTKLLADTLTLFQLGGGGGEDYAQ